jgi:ubiquinone/menaquinone biosynthesis C-methylase UbiE
LTRRYFGDVKRVFSEMYRVLRPTKHAIVVVCPSHIRKVEIPTHEVLTEIGGDVGFRIKRQYSRTINERRRLLPYIKKSFGNRMDTEYILIFQKT